MNRPIFFWNWDILFARARHIKRSRRVYRLPSIQNLGQRSVFNADLESLADDDSNQSDAAYVYTPGSSDQEFYGPVQPSIYGPVQPFESEAESSSDYGVLLASTYARHQAAA